MWRWFLYIKSKTTKLKLGRLVVGGECVAPQITLRRCCILLRGCFFRIEAAWPHTLAR